MTKTDDDKLLREFFSERKQEEIADNGFSRRVMRNLPDRSNRLTQWWTTLMAVIGLALFWKLGGWEAMLGNIREVFSGMINQGVTTLDLRSLAIAGIVLLFLGTRKICSMA